MSSDERYFHRRKTHQLIAELSRPADLTVYLGAGVTADRTGLTWTALLDGLWSPFEPDAEVRSSVISSLGQMRVTTLVEAEYQKDPSPTERFLVTLRGLLYGGRRVMNGRLLDAVVELARQLAMAGRSVVIVTPNYDDYLVAALAYAEAEAAKRGENEIPVGLTFLGADTSEDEIDSGALPSSLAPGTIHVVHIHGFLPRSDALAPDIVAMQRRPVFSERDYQATRGRSTAVLEALLMNRNALLVGTSVADPPLIDALAATRESTDEGIRRIAVNARQSSILSSDDVGFENRLVHWHEARLAALGVEAELTDFHVQVGQLIHEVSKAIEHGDGATMVDFRSPRRYGTRLVDWWSQWSATNCASPRRQGEHHELLLEALDEIRIDLGADLDEALKLEAWVRWHPESSRELAQWASSTGSWPDLYSMRKGEIGAESPFVAVRTFCNGAPLFQRTPPSLASRWRSYLGTPIWLQRPEGEITVGVVLLASMNPQVESSVSSSNLERLDQVLFRMKKLGREILTP